MARARPAVVGSFVLGALALVVAGILFFGGSRLFLTSTRAVIFFQGSVAGLDIGAPVTFRGVRVGMVRRIAIEVSGKHTPQIPVTIEIASEHVIADTNSRAAGLVSIPQLVADGLRAQLSLQSFVTGQLAIELDFLPGTPARMVAADTGGLPQIPSVSSDLERLRASLAELPVQQLAQSLQRALTTGNHALGIIDTRIGPLLDSARHATDSATRTLDTSREAVLQLQVDISRSLSGIDKLVAEGQQQLGDRGAELSRLLQSADATARHADALLVTLNGLTGQRAEFRGNLEGAARDLAATVSSLRDFARTVDRDPSALLRGRSGR